MLTSSNHYLRLAKQYEVKAEAEANADTRKSYFQMAANYRKLAASAKNARQTRSEPLRRRR